MKRILVMMVAAFSLTATCFAEGKNENQDWSMNVNVMKLSKYLNLENKQMTEVEAISDYFADRIKNASYAKDEKQAQKVREAVYGNFKLMKRTLTAEQFKKYVALMNTTLRNKGLDVYMEDMATR
jgi:23S rRNA A2030 N6-methylase RlmJ